MIMLTVEKFKAQLIRPNHPDWHHVGVDTKDKSQLYIIVNGGLGNINCARIEQYAPEIKVCVLNMVAQDELHLKPNNKSLRIGQGHRIYSYTLKSGGDLSQAEPIVRNIYFSSLFIRWQRTHELSDKQAQEMLSLTAKEFHQFRDDELTITQALINKLAEVTGMSIQFWQNRWDQKKRDVRGNNENI
jgi:plasmid maintenance system antidote protein VapI